MHTTRRLRVPSKFWHDHADRCPSDDAEAGICVQIEQSGNRVLIEGTPEQIECLRSDAEFYAQGNVDDCRALVASAKATLAAIAKSA